MKKNKNTSGVVWVTGYSASGKTSVGRKLKDSLLADGVPTIFLDGDDLRSIFASRWGYEREERIELAKVYFRLCSHLASQGFTVVISAVAMYKEVRLWLKENVPHAVEAYLDVPEDERRIRDSQTKHLYNNQDFQKMYEAPQAADIVVHNYGEIAPEHAAQQIKEYFLTVGLNRSADRGKKKHWDTFYKSAVAPSKPSPFAEHVADRIGEQVTVLEVGCGNGRDASLFGDIGHSVVALDASEKAIQFCQKNCQRPSIKFIWGTADKLAQIEGEKFDVVYSRFCIHAMTRREEANFMEAASKLIKPDGKIFIECRSIHDALAREGEVISLTERIHGHYRRFIVLDELKKTMISTVFDILEAVESKGLAKFGDEDPVVIRIEARLV